MDMILALVLAISSPCPNDDSGSDCYWNAATRGNGVGHSFIVLDMGATDLVIRDDATVDVYDHVEFP